MTKLRLREVEQLAKVTKVVVVALISAYSFPPLGSLGPFPGVCAMFCCVVCGGAFVAVLPLPLSPLQQKVPLMSTGSHPI